MDYKVSYIQQWHPKYGTHYTQQVRLTADPEYLRTSYGIILHPGINYTSVNTFWYIIGRLGIHTDRRILTGRNSVILLEVPKRAKDNILEYEDRIRGLVQAKGEEEETTGTYRYWLGDLNGVCDFAGHTDVLSVVASDQEVSVQVNTPDDMSTIFEPLGAIPFKVVKAIYRQLTD